MKHAHLALMLALLPAVSHASSDLSVLPQGRYGCWTAGSASGPAVNPQSTFTVLRGSSYRNDAGTGTYLLANDVLLFTRGPLKDMLLRRSKDGFWQEMTSRGEIGRLKCSRTGPVLPGNES